MLKRGDMAVVNGKYLNHFKVDIVGMVGIISYVGENYTDITPLLNMFGFGGTFSIPNECVEKFSTEARIW